MLALALQLCYLAYKSGLHAHSTVSNAIALDMELEPLSEKANIGVSCELVSRNYHSNYHRL